MRKSKQRGNQTGGQHRGRRRRDRPGGARAGESAPQRYWLYGRHAVVAALANPRRRVHRLVVQAGTASPDAGPQAEVLDAPALAALLPAGAVHQGLAAEVEPLPPVTLEDACRPAADSGDIVVVLDQVADPRNIGAVLRSAAAFEARALVLPDRHSPAESAAMAKAASGALELVPLVRVANLARALDQLAGLGYWRYGLTAGQGPALDEADLSGNCVLVLGAEGEGLRRLTVEQCDILAHLPISATIDSLNVSAAAAVALFTARRRLAAK